MKPEYVVIYEEAICKADGASRGWAAASDIRAAIEACEALAKPRELTDAEVDECWRAYVSYPHYKQSILGVIAKADEIRARPAEETVPFDYEQWSKGGWQAISETGNVDTVLYAAQKYHSMRREP